MAMRVRQFVRVPSHPRWLLAAMVSLLALGAVLGEIEIRERETDSNSASPSGDPSLAARVRVRNGLAAAGASLLALLLAGLPLRSRRSRRSFDDHRSVQKILQSMEDALIVADRSGAIRKVNAAACRMSGYTMEELLALPAHRVVKKRLEGARGETVSGQTTGLRSVFMARTVLHTKEGKDLPVACSQSIVRDDGDGIQGVVFVIRDISERIRFEEALTEAMHSAEAANQAKSDFLANMSHEIRTPMTAILGFTDLLLEPDQDADGREECVRTIQRNGSHLLSLINDVLDISRIEAGKVELAREPMAPLALTNEVASSLRARSGAKEVEVVVKEGEALPDRVQGDPTRVRQILENLVGNALKFTGQGQVTVDVEYEPGPGTRGWLRFRVTDTGVGMSPSEIERIFEPFHQADTSTTRRFGGTGLGLTITRRLTELLHGTVEVESEPGRGSRFTVRLPVEAAGTRRDRRRPDDTAPSEEQPGGDAVEGRLQGRILLAEDGRDNQRLVSHILTKAGARVEIAENGKIAVEKALAAKREGAPFDLILMDMQMPEMDGYTATARLRESGYLGSIVALTAHAMKGDRKKCIDAGCDDYVTKPVHRNRLLAHVARVLQTNRSADDPPPVAF